MNRFMSLITLVGFFSVSYGQTIWTTPVKITSGSSEDSDPTFATVQNNFGRTEELLAFVRRHPMIDESAICLLKSSPDGSSWVDTVYTIIDDSVGGDDEPTLASLPPGAPVRSMLLWHRWGSGSNIYYSFDSEGVWISPRALTSDSLENRAPRVAPFSGGFGAVWQRDGMIAYSEFSGDHWSPPEIVSLHQDSANTSPELRYLNYFGSGNPHPMIVWEKMKSEDTSRMIFYAARGDSGWSPPDTVSGAGDNRRPRFFKNDFERHFSISWESNRTGNWSIYAAAGTNYTGSISWEMRDEPLLPASGADDRDGSFMVLPIIICNCTAVQQFPYFAAGSWSESSNGRDTIVASIFYGGRKSFSADTLNLHPDVSCGVSVPGGQRVWCAWESGPPGESKIVVISTDIILGVPEDDKRPVGFSLMQNYPNPFNPRTRIDFNLPEAGRVQLRIYNLLGEEIESLVDGYYSAGLHTTTWDGSGRPSGVYFYRIETRHRSQVRAMTLIR